MSEEKAKLELDGKTYELPVITGTENEKAIDISKLRAETQYITLDRGFKNTGSAKSAITFLNGEEGVLRYRGYTIEELAANSDFLEVCYLLIYGELPKRDEYETFKDSIIHHSLVHEDMKRFYEAYPPKAHPMGILASMVCSLSTFYPESQNPNRPPKAINLTIQRLIAKIPTLAGWAYKNSVGHPIMYPRNDLSYTGNFLYMM
ncbi:MAG: citrate/2-methylcitrate synthase, partial [Flavobacteriales bacterium]